MKKYVLLAAVAALFVGLIAGPSSAVANHTDAGVFTGSATVSPGLTLPGATPVAGTWSLNAAVTAVLNGSQTLSANGNLSPVAGIGAACGISNGSGGTGTLGAYYLSDLGWVSSAGGLLPVTGHYQLGNATTPNDTDSGPIVAAVYATGADKCVGGATTFTVGGAAALL